MNLQPVLALAWNASIGIPLLLASAIILLLIWWIGQPKKPQGRRRPVEPETVERREPSVGADDSFFDSVDEPRSKGTALADEVDPNLHDPVRRQKGRREPHLAQDRVTLKSDQGELEVGLRAELEKLDATLAGESSGITSPTAGTPVTSAMPKPSSQAASIIAALRSPTPLDSQFQSSDASTHEAADGPAPQPITRRASQFGSAMAPTPATEPPARAPPQSDLGKRPPQMPVERIVTLYVVAREGSSFNGPDLIVAAEKAGVEFGDMGIYHRLIDGKRELGPVFSVANMLKPGNFDLSQLESLRTPGLSFFMALPAPVPALDAWDAMLPAAQRMGELLDGYVLDEERNGLGRQRIAHIRDQLRGWDRDHEGEEVIFGR